jgi:hypothetical protein
MICTPSYSGWTSWPPLFLIVSCLQAEFSIRLKWLLAHYSLAKPWRRCGAPNTDSLVKQQREKDRMWGYPCNRSRRPIRFWDVEDPIFSIQHAHNWWWGCQSYASAGCPLPPGGFLVPISRGRVNPRDAVRPEGLGKLKNKINDLFGNRIRELPPRSIVPQLIKILIIIIINCSI